MLLLVTDTSGKQGGVALAECEAGESCAIIEVVPLAGGTFSAQLVPQIAALLEKHGYRKTDLAGFAVVSGPGSFTGLRVGLAAIKALAEVLHQPIAAISLLEAIARSSRAHGRVIAVLNAGRGEVYAGDYDLEPQAHIRKVHSRSERLLSREAFLVEARERVVVTPEPDLAEAARAAGGTVELIDHPRSDAIARLGWERIQRGDTVRPEELEANYIRHSDAEIFSKPTP
jgi:tRNA threonylcarbamoyladenosine biosynthesis protein TsaB